MAIEFELNGRREALDTDADRTLIWVPRGELELTGTKFGSCPSNRRRWRRASAMARASSDHGHQFERRIAAPRGPSSRRGGASRPRNSPSP